MHTFKHKYLPVSAASRFSGYHADYITQLCRKKKTQCINKSKVWFISVESLLKQLSQSKKKTTSGDINSFLSDMVTISPQVSGHVAFHINGRKFIDSQEAANISGYNRDYLTEMARNNEIQARKLGKVWFFDLINIESLQASQQSKPKKRGTEQSATNHNNKKQTQFAQKSHVTAGHQLAYEAEPLSESIPSINSRPAKSIPILKRVNNKPAIYHSSENGSESSNPINKNTLAESEKYNKLHKVIPNNAPNSSNKQPTEQFPQAATPLTKTDNDNSTPVKVYKHRAFVYRSEYFSLDELDERESVSDLAMSRRKRKRLTYRPLAAKTQKTDKKLQNLRPTQTAVPTPNGSILLDLTNAILLILSIFMMLYFNLLNLGILELPYRTFVY